MRTESRSANASQNEAYRVVARIQATTRRSSSTEGMIPSRTIPRAVTRIARAPSMTTMTAMPAANFPFTTSSRWIGWARSRDSVPWLRSLLMPSNPNAMPTSGTSSAAKATVVTPPTLLEPTTNSARNTAGCPASCGAELLMSVEMK